MRAGNYDDIKRERFILPEKTRLFFMNFDSINGLTGN